MHVFNLLSLTRSSPPNPIWLGFIFMTFFDSTWVNFAFVLHVLTCCARCSKKMSLGGIKEGL